jgi:hypothetical protein
VKLVAREMNSHQFARHRRQKAGFVDVAAVALRVNLVMLVRREKRSPVSA